MTMPVCFLRLPIYHHYPRHWRWLLKLHAHAVYTTDLVYALLEHTYSVYIPKLVLSFLVVDLVSFISTWTCNLRAVITLGKRKSTVELAPNRRCSKSIDTVRFGKHLTSGKGKHTG